MVEKSWRIPGLFYFCCMQITGIILAGGKSRRMKTDKALIEIEGKTLLRRAVEFCQSFKPSLEFTGLSPILWIGKDACKCLVVCSQYELSS